MHLRLLCALFTTSLLPTSPAALQIEVTPPVLHHLKPKFNVYTDTFYVWYSVLGHPSDNPQVETGSTTNNRVYKDGDKQRIDRDYDRTEGLRSYQVLSSPVVNQSVFQELVVECLAQNLPIQLDTLILDYIKEDLHRHQVRLSSLSPKMRIIDDALNPLWFLNKGLTHCRIDAQTGSLTWALNIPVHQALLSFKVLELQPIPFRLNDVTCSWAATTTLVAVSERRIFRVNMNDRRFVGSATRITPYQEESDETKCILAIIQNDWELSKIVCTLQCSNVADSSLVNWNSRALVSSMSHTILRRCQTTEAIPAPTIGAVNMSFPCDCSVQTSPSQDPVYPESCGNTSSSTTLLLPTTWVKTKHFSKCTHMEECLEILPASSSSKPQPSIGNVLPSRKNIKKYYWGDAPQVTPKSSHSESVIMMLIQLAFLVLTIPFSMYVICRYPLARAIYLLHFLSFTSGLGDVEVQVGPKDVIPKSIVPDITWDSEKVSSLVALVVVFIAIGLAVGLSCCLCKCGRRKCGCAA